MILHSEFVAYFKTIAEKHKMLQHNDETNKIFREISMDELAGDTSGMFSATCFLIECESGGISGANWDSLYDSPDGAFVIAKACRPEDRVQERQILDDVKKIIAQILGKMKNDYFNKNALIKHLDHNSIRYQKVLGFGDNHIGWRVQFSFKTSAKVIYNSNDWLPDAVPE